MGDSTIYSTPWGVECHQEPTVIVSATYYASLLAFLASHLRGRPMGNGRKRRPNADSSLLMNESLPNGRPVRVRKRIMSNVAG